ncbi:MAG TPA: ABC transporter ATP-binding protein [Thomasclavelia ramosa]|nr:ABC transporter ATP-binding protein [Thomasclavelia ramosa]
MIEVKELNKKYGKTTVLSNINITFNAGHTYGVMGENGAGKSTLFRCIMRLEGYDGKIEITKGLNVGYLPDTPYFYSLVTGMEFIEFCLKARGLKIDYNEIDAVNDLFRLPLNRFPSSYSMGMRKRLVLMILILQHSDYYILDEPFNGLDLAGSILLKKWILRMKADGKMVVLSSHIISSLTDICDEITYIHAGNIVGTYRGLSAEEIEKDITTNFITDTVF